ncbi:MAG: hypothetical protein DMG12_17490 [Acidobacteria bacterium]|nr:MAG: hypothetical protein DMG12_17490 [Acidobacteriota bacterium]
MHDVIVIGEGVIGLSIGRALAGRRSVLLLDRGATGEGASWAAAGMLCSALDRAFDARRMVSGAGHAGDAIPLIGAIRGLKLADSRYNFERYDESGRNHTEGPPRRAPFL